MVASLEKAADERGYGLRDAEAPRPLRPRPLRQRAHPPPAHDRPGGDGGLVRRPRPGPAKRRDKPGIEDRADTAVTGGGSVTFESTVATTTKRTAGSRTAAPSRRARRRPSRPRPRRPPAAPKTTPESRHRERPQLGPDCCRVWCEAVRPPSAGRPTTLGRAPAGHGGSGRTRYLPRSGRAGGRRGGELHGRRRGLGPAAGRARPGGGRCHPDPGRPPQFLVGWRSAASAPWSP